MDIKPKSTVEPTRIPVEERRLQAPAPKPEELDRGQFSQNPTSSAHLLAQHLLTPGLELLPTLVTPALNHVAKLITGVNNLNDVQLSHTKALINSLKTGVEKARQTEAYKNSAWYQAKPSDETDWLRPIRFLARAARLWGGADTLANHVDSVNIGQLDNQLAIIDKRQGVLSKEAAQKQARASEQAQQAQPLAQQVVQQQVQASLSQPPSGQYTVDPREIERRRAKDEANDDFSEGDMDESEATLPPTPQAEVDDIDDGDATQVSTPKGDVTTTTRTRIATPRSADTLPQTRRAEPDERATLANLGALELAARFEPLGKGETEDASLLQKWAQHNTNLLNAVSLEKLQQITSSLIPTVLGRGLHQLREELEDAEKMHPNRNIPERAQLRRALDRVDGLINRSGRFD